VEGGNVLGQAVALRPDASHRMAISLGVLAT